MRDHDHAWAVLAETLPAIRGILTSSAAGTAGLPTADEVEAHAAQLAMLRSPNLTGGVAVLPLRGVITPGASLLSMLMGGTSLQGFRASLRDALNNDEVASILIDVNSPGGSTSLVAETAAELREARGTKRIVAVTNTLCASAAYWIASQADEVIVTPSGQIGSIGVYMLHNDWSSWNEKFGIDPTYIYAGGLFTGDVAKGRGVRQSAVKSGFGEGRCVTARRAVELGMADRVDTFEATVARMVRNPRSGGRGGRADDYQPAPAADETEPQTGHQQDPASGDQERLAEICASLDRTTDSLTGKE